MKTFVEDAGIIPYFSTRGGMSVGLYIVSLSNGERSFSYWRENSAARTLAADLNELLLEKGDVAYFSGITLAILPNQSRETLLNVLKAARAKGVIIAFDPNLRPCLWASNADMCGWTTMGAAISDICLPSFDDEALYFGDATPLDTAQRYAKGGSATVIVKNGANPVLIYDGTETEVTLEPVANVVDTTAAGDSFNGQFLASLMRGANNEDAAKEACALSGQVVRQLGALVDVEIKE